MSEETTTTTTTTPVLNIHQRIVAIMAAVPYVQKVQRKTGLQYSFVNRDAVVSKLRVAMIEHGVTYMPHVLEFAEQGNRLTATVCHTYTNIDDPADVITFTTIGYGIDPQDKGPGKAVTYAEKLAHLKLFMIEAGDEDECEHYDIPADTATAAKPTIKAGKTEPAEVVKPGIEEAKVAYKDMRAKTGLSNEFMVAAFGKDIKKASADEITAFVKEIEKRWCYKNDLCDAIDKYSPNKDTMDECLAMHGVSDVVDWHLIDSARLHALVESLHHRFDLPFPTDKE